MSCLTRKLEVTKAAGSLQRPKSEIRRERDAGRADEGARAEAVVGSAAARGAAGLGGVGAGGGEEEDGSEGDAGARDGEADRGEGALGFRRVEGVLFVGGADVAGTARFERFFFFGCSLA